MLPIDRKTFLGLAFGMAGVAACRTGAPSAAVNVIDIPKQPAAQDAGGAVVTTVTEPDQPVAKSDEDDDDDEMLPSPVDENGGVMVAASTCGWVDPKKVTRASGTCDDSQGTAPSCNALKACGGFSFPKEQCESYRKHFKPKAAQRAIDCMNKLTQKQLCDDACNAYRCGDQALKGSCPDPSADAQCQALATRCKTLTVAECRMYLSALNVAGRQKMVACLTAKGGCSAGIFSCSEGL